MSAAIRAAAPAAGEAAAAVPVQAIPEGRHQEATVAAVRPHTVAVAEAAAMVVAVEGEGKF